MTKEQTNKNADGVSRQVERLVIFATINNKSEIVMSGFKSKQNAINYVITFPEKHMPSFFIKEVNDYGLWDCFIKQI